MDRYSTAIEELVFGEDRSAWVDICCNRVSYASSHVCCRMTNIPKVVTMDKLHVLQVPEQGREMGEEGMEQDREERGERRGRGQNGSRRAGWEEERREGEGIEKGGQGG